MSAACLFVNAAVFRRSLASLQLLSYL